MKNYFEGTQNVRNDEEMDFEKTSDASSGYTGVKGGTKKLLPTIIEQPYMNEISMDSERIIAG